MRFEDLASATYAKLRCRATLAKESVVLASISKLTMNCIIMARSHLNTLRIPLETTPRYETGSTYM